MAAEQITDQSKLSQEIKLAVQTMNSWLIGSAVVQQDGSVFYTEDLPGYLMYGNVTGYALERPLNPTDIDSNIHPHWKRGAPLTHPDINIFNTFERIREKIEKTASTLGITVSDDVRPYMLGLLYKHELAAIPVEEIFNSDPYASQKESLAISVVHILADLYAKATPLSHYEIAQLFKKFDRLDYELAWRLACRYVEQHIQNVEASLNENMPIHHEGDLADYTNASLMFNGMTREQKMQWFNQARRNPNNFLYALQIVNP